MKAILISDHAKWCALMMNGDKTIEVRKGTALYKATKRLIDEYGFAEFYVYCTKGKSLIYTDGTDGKGDYVDYKYYESYKGDKNDIGSGKVLFKFRCYKVEEIKPKIKSGLLTTYQTYETNSLVINPLLDKCCLSYEELDRYLNKKNGCAIHISDLEIFDKPKELSEFVVCTAKNHTCVCSFPYPCKKCVYMNELTKAPQSWCYIEVQYESSKS